MCVGPGNFILVNKPSGLSHINTTVAESIKYNSEHGLWTVKSSQTGEYLVVGHLICTDLTRQIFIFELPYF